jgi:hypothetical protein
VSQIAGVPAIIAHGLNDVADIIGVTAPIFHGLGDYRWALWAKLSGFSEEVTEERCAIPLLLAQPLLFGIRRMPLRDRV